MNPKAFSISIQRKTSPRGSLGACVRPCFNLGLFGPSNTNMGLIGMLRSLTYSIST